MFSTVASGTFFWMTRRQAANDRLKVSISTRPNGNARVRYREAYESMSSPKGGGTQGTQLPS